MRTPITNGLIAISTFFLILFVIMTIHSYEKALSNVQIKTPKTSVSDVTIRHPTADIDEGSFFLFLLLLNFPS